MEPEGVGAGGMVGSTLSAAMEANNVARVKAGVRASKLDQIHSAS